ncbi:zinc transporter ZntB [Cobetia sp. SIMBA_158]|uniref:zinc transporter ZntB n=1 Tax=Cobetia sp. SIMBA_158 TaxID=3081617 RepID=UPI000D1C0125|nr:zinc transporter ZntB [Halomonas sp. SF2003]
MTDATDPQAAPAPVLPAGDAPTTALVSAYRLDGKGGASLLDDDSLREQWQDPEALIWMHLDYTRGDVNDYLDDLAQLDEPSIEALTELDTRPRVARFGGGMVTTLRGINLNPGAAPEDLLSLRLWMSPTRLITLRRRPFQSITQVREQLEAGQGAESISWLLAMLSDALVDRVAELSHRLDEQLAIIEEDQLNDVEIDPDDITRLRRPLITLRRFMGPQRDCLAQLSQGPLWIDEQARLDLREIANQLSRYVEDFQAMQERALIIHEQRMSEHNEQLNQRMYLLSVITAVFLPLGFLTGLLGVNVGGIPGSDSQWGFAAFVGITLGVVAMQMWLLKRKKWW